MGSMAVDAYLNDEMVSPVSLRPQAIVALLETSSRSSELVDSIHKREEDELQVSSRLCGPHGNNSLHNML